MEGEHGLMAQIDRLFHPQSVAVVGVPRGMKMGKLFLIALRDQGFPGPIYPVHPEAVEIDGLRAYPSVSAIPGPVDLAIVLTPHLRTLQVIRECAEKGVRGAILFTAGYKETGTAEGKALEEEMVRVARAAGVRLIGPNCMGLYSPESGLSFFPELSREPGPVGLISQSGSLGNILGRLAPRRGIRFSKAVSLGNQCDLTSADFLMYLGQDPDTRLIGTYLEGIVDGRRFLDALQRASLAKPVILWKVGLTPEGGTAAFSHTGSLAGSRPVWEGIVRQSGGVPVEGFEAWIDALVGFSFLPEVLGDRMAIISGPGGLAVAAAEACGREGLRLADLSAETRRELARFVPATGTSLSNPIDVGLTASLKMEIYAQSARAAASDPGVDAVLMIGMGFSVEENRQHAQRIIQIQRELGKPFLMVNIPGFDPDFGTPFFEGGMPFFETAERALRTYRLAHRYREWKSRRLGFA